MRFKKVDVFVRPDSQRCDEVVGFANKNNLPVTFVDITSEEGNELVQKHNILSLPTAIVFDDSGSIVDRLYNLEEIKDFFGIKQKEK